MLQTTTDDDRRQIASPFCCPLLYTVRRLASNKLRSWVCSSVNGSIDDCQAYESVNYTASVASEPSTVKMSKTSSHNSCLKHSSSVGSHSELLTFSRDSLGSPKSFYSSGASDYYSRDDDAASSGVGDKPPDIPEINEVRRPPVRPATSSPRLTFINQKIDKC